MGRRIPDFARGRGARHSTARFSINTSETPRILFLGHPFLGHLLVWFFFFFPPPPLPPLALVSGDARLRASSSPVRTHPFRVGPGPSRPISPGKGKKKGSGSGPPLPLWYANRAPTCVPHHAPPPSTPRSNITPTHNLQSPDAQISRPLPQLHPTEFRIHDGQLLYHQE